MPEPPSPGARVPMTDRILAEKRDGVGTLTVNNPERRNAVSLEMWRAAEAVLVDFRDDPGVRVVVVTGAGGRAFVSGADISKFDSERATAEAVAAYGAQTERVYALLHGFPKPTIAEIHGACVGGGVALAVCCDLRFCAEESRFGIPAARLGLGYGLRGMKRLADVVGPAFAKEMLFTARLFSAAEAHHMGLVNRVLPDAELGPHVAACAATIAGNAPLTIAAAKRALDEAMKDESERDVAAVEAMVEACFASEDYAEGRRAFLEKRPPVFRGR